MAEVDDKTYEVKKTLKLSNHLQLIDLNGTRKNFQSDFIVQSGQPGKEFKVCVITQPQLDSGEIPFELSENGKYARRVTYRENEHVNHYIAVKAAKPDEEIEVHSVVRLKEMTPQPTVPTSTPAVVPNEQPVLNSPISQSARQELQNQLMSLSQEKSYQNLPHGESLPNEFDDHDDIVIPTALPSPTKKKWNIWIIVGVLCIAVCVILFLRSKGYFGGNGKNDKNDKNDDGTGHKSSHSHRRHRHD